jgi:hypothetical protein
MLPVIFMPLRYNKLFAYILLGVSIIIELFGFSLVWEFMSKFTNSFEIYTSYMYNSRFGAKSQSGVTFYLKIAVSIILLYFYEPKDKLKILALYLFLLGIIFESIGRQISILLRLKTYFDIYGILVLQEVINIISFKKVKSLKYIYLIIVLFYFSLAFIRFVYLNDDMGFSLYNPYRLVGF